MLLLLSPADFIKIVFFQKKKIQEYYQSVSLDPDQDRHSVGPVVPNCLQRLSVDNKVTASKGSVKKGTVSLLAVL